MHCMENLLSTNDSYLTPRGESRGREGDAMSDIVPFDEGLDPVYEEIRQILVQARIKAWQSVNTEMVTAYWEIGRAIVQEEQRGAARAEYGQRVIAELSRRLSAEFGKGFGRSIL